MELLQAAAAHPGGHAAGTSTWEETHDDIFGREYLLTRPLLEAISVDTPTVLLIDEIDKVDFEFEALLLEILSDFQVTIPELGTVAAVHQPYVVLTSNSTRELSEALKRRCLYLHMDYPDIGAREGHRAVRACPRSPSSWPTSWSGSSGRLRNLDLKKSPVDLRDPRLGADAAGAGLRHDHRRGRRHRRSSVVLKYQADMEKALKHLAVPPDPSLN